jgi:hypothetical protein
MKNYPAISPALPKSYITPSRTSQLLKPGIVLFAVLILLLSSGGGIGAAVVIFWKGSLQPNPTIVSASQGFMTIAVSAPNSSHIGGEID